MLTGVFILKRFFIYKQSRSTIPHCRAFSSKPIMCINQIHPSLDIWSDVLKILSLLTWTVNVYFVHLTQPRGSLQMGAYSYSVILYMCNSCLYHNIIWLPILDSSWLVVKYDTAAKCLFIVTMFVDLLCNMMSRLKIMSPKTEFLQSAYASGQPTIYHSRKTDFRHLVWEKLHQSISPRICLDPISKQLLNRCMCIDILSLSATTSCIKLVNFEISHFLY